MSFNRAVNAPHTPSATHIELSQGSDVHSRRQKGTRRFSKEQGCPMFYQVQAFFITLRFPLLYYTKFSSYIKHEIYQFCYNVMFVFLK
jgi:hypothetical protein